MKTMLPDLPGKKGTEEADFGLWLVEYDREHNLEAGDYELKQTGTDSIPFDCLDPLQADSALRTESQKGNLTRVIMGTKGAADYKKTRLMPAYVVIRYPSCVCFVRIGDFLKEKLASKRKSLTSFRAAEIASKVIHI